MTELEEFLVRGVLRAYGIENAQTEILRHLGNTVVRVQTDHLQYALRICTPEVTAQRLTEELEWLKALQRNTDLVVPTPVANACEKLITTWVTSEDESTRCCVLFKWIEGEPVGQQMSLETAAAIGTMMAKLHRNARSYIPYRHSAFVGPQYSLTWMIGPNSWWGSGQAQQALGVDVYAQLAPVIALAAKAMRTLGETSNVFGIIHSDLHFGNILVVGDRYAAIDFDGCALGHYLFDVAVTEMEFLDYEAGESYIEVFRQHYCEGLGIPALSPGLVSTFMIPAGVVFLEWVFSSPNPAVRSSKLKWVPLTVERMLDAAQRATSST